MRLSTPSTTLLGTLCRTVRLWLPSLFKQMVLASPFIAIGGIPGETAAQKAIDTAYYEAALSKANKLMAESHDAGLEAFTAIRGEALASGYKKGFLEGYYGMARYFYNKRDYKRAGTIYDSIATMAKVNGLKEMQVKALHAKGITLNNRNMHYTAAQNALECLNLCDSLGNEMMTIHALGLLGSIYSRLENFSKSRSYFAIGKELAKRKGYQAAFFTSSFNYCDCLINEKKYGEALTCLESFYSEFRPHNRDKDFLYINSYLQNAWLRCEPKDTATLNEIYGNLMFLKDQKVFQQGATDKVQVLAALSRYYILKGDPENAKKYLEQWRPIVFRSQETEDKGVEILLVESNLYKLLGDHETSLKYYRRYMEQRVHSLKKNEANRVHELTLNYEAEKKDRLIATKEMELKLLNEATKKRQWFLVFLLSTIFLAGLTGLVIYLRYRNRILKKAKKEAEMAAEEKSTFLDVVTHELRTPLSTIAGSIYLLDSENGQNTGKGYMKSIKYSSEYLNKLIENTVALKALDRMGPSAPATQENPGQRFNCRQLIEELCEPLAHSKNRNQATITIDPHLPKFIIGPEADLTIILSNLIGNADKFTKNGLLKISIEQDTAYQDGALWLTFTITDNGMGIRDAEKELVFEPFYSGKDHKDGEGLGIGIGLNLTKRLLEKHGSQAHLRSAIGVGTSVSFTMPFDIPLELRADFQNDIKTATEPRKGGILLVEDNKANQEITRRIIEKLGYPCDVADNGEIAVEKYGVLPYSLVLMDMMMPVMNGFEATERIKKIDPHANIVALTAISKDKYEDIFKELNIKTVISKPISIKTIRKVLEQSFGKDVPENLLWDPEKFEQP